MSIQYVVYAINSEIAAKNLLIASGVKKSKKWFDDFEQLLLEVEYYMDCGGYMTEETLPDT